MAKTTEKKEETKKYEVSDEQLADALKARDEAKAAAEADPTNNKLNAAADDANQEYEDLFAKHAAEREENPMDAEPSTAEDAKVVLPEGVDPKISAGSPDAIKKGNDPANPAPPDGYDPEKDETVRLQRKSADAGGTISYIDVGAKMVGDYLRAGWSTLDGADPITGKMR